MGSVFFLHTPQSKPSFCTWNFKKFLKSGLAACAGQAPGLEVRERGYWRFPLWILFLLHFCAAYMPFWSTLCLLSFDLSCPLFSSIPSPESHKEGRRNDSNPRLLSKHLLDVVIMPLVATVFSWQYLCGINYWIPYKRHKWRLETIKLTC